jgi:hypothetical protein
MGKCGSCKCNSSSKCNPERFSNLPEKRIKQEEKDVFSLLNDSLSKEKIDTTSLDLSCKHYLYGKMLRYQCDLCIREYVQGVDFKQSMKEAERYYNIGKKIASARIIAEAKEFKHKQRIKD